jgi:DNA repair photolyase
LDPRKKRIPMKPSFMLLGGGVGDAYQPVEKECKLARGVLELFLESGCPVEILTKSTLALRDLDLLKQIHVRKRVVVNFSFSSVDETLCRIFEPGVPSPAERLDAIREIRKQNIPCGVFLMPVLPFLTDTREQLEKMIKAIREAGAEFVVFGGLTLKPGRQRDHYYSHLEKHFPAFLTRYRHIYGDNPYGAGSEFYYRELNKRFYSVIRKTGLPVRMPAEFFADILDENDRVVVMLEQIDYMLKLRGAQSSYGFAAHTLSRLHQPLSEIGDLKSIKGIGSQTEKVIREILGTGTSRLYDTLLYYR